MTSLRGRLLVATPQLVDPNFSRTVVLLVDHGDAGAFGLVVNRPTDALLAEVVEAEVGPASAPAVLFLGGPVGGDQVIGLGLRHDAEPAPGWVPLPAELGEGGLGSVDLEAAPEEDALVELRVFVGYAGWGVGQLEREIEEGSWFVVDADLPSDLFGARPDRLWADVLRRQPGRTAWFANAPDDVSTN